MRSVSIGKVTFGNHLPLCLIAGPCVMESRDHAIMMATELKAMTDRLGIGFVFKTSFDKANRSSKDSFRGVSITEANTAFGEMARLGIPTLTDVHERQQCKLLNVDVLQIPALLCRQTDLIEASGLTGLPVNLKKGQFMSPHEMLNVIEKVGHDQVLLTERGTTFGYNNLVADMRSLSIMARTGYPVIFDATHSVQQPASLGISSGGDRAMVPVLAKAAVATGIAGVFIETHDNPDAALCDGPNMVRLDDMPGLVSKLMQIDRLK